MKAFARTYALPAVEPFRLDLTVAVLRRFSTNVVDVVTDDGVYLRAHETALGPATVAVSQSGPAAVEVALDAPDAAHDALLASVARTLGLARTTPAFASGAARVPWLGALAGRMAGVKPPRYATLWEACVNAIVFQQVSLFAATAILGRVIGRLSPPVACAGRMLFPFPAPDAFARVDDATLRAAGLSAAKIATLRRVADALGAGALVEADLAALPTPQAAEALRSINGIGPWTAAVVCLRGLGRLDVFPENDSGVARSLAVLTGTAVDVPATLGLLAPEQGMLYFHLLLARLEARGEIAPVPR